MKLESKQTPKTNKPKKTPHNQTNQPTHPVLFHPTLSISTSLDTFWFSEKFSHLLSCFVWSVVSCTSHFKNKIHKDLSSFTSGQKSSITTLKYPVKIGTHFKHYFVFSLAEFPKPPHPSLLCLLYTGNMLLSHGTVTYIIRSPHILEYISILNSFWNYMGKTVKGCRTVVCVVLYSNIHKLFQTVIFERSHQPASSCTHGL